MRKHAEIYILTRSSGEYEDHTVEVVGVTTRKEEADAWVNAGTFSNQYGHDFETRKLNELDSHPLAAIRMWQNPQTNPMCKCGHRLMHHRSGVKKACKHNSEYAHNKHKCPGFRLQEEPCPTKP